MVDKEAGWTSHDVVARARKLLDTRKVGHSGTLDPSATGVSCWVSGVVLGCCASSLSSRRRYEATFRLGVETSTLDAEGK